MFQRKYEKCSKLQILTNKDYIICFLKRTPSNSIRSIIQKRKTGAKKKYIKNLNMLTKKAWKLRIEIKLLYFKANMRHVADCKANFN